MKEYKSIEAATSATLAMYVSEEAKNGFELVSIFFAVGTSKPWVAFLSKALK